MHLSYLVDEGEDEDDEGMTGRSRGGGAPLHGKLPALDALLADALVVPGGEEGEDEDDEGMRGRSGGGGKEDPELRGSAGGAEEEVGEEELGAMRRS